MAGLVVAEVVADLIGEVVVVKALDIAAEVFVDIVAGVIADEDVNVVVDIGFSQSELRLTLWNYLWKHAG